MKNERGDLDRGQKGPIMIKAWRFESVFGSHKNKSWVRQNTEKRLKRKASPTNEERNGAKQLKLH